MNFQEMLQQAEKLKEEMQRRQEELAGQIFEGEAGAGMVQASVNGKHEVVSITIDPESAPLDDLPMLQNLIQGALNNALDKSRQAAQGLLSQMLMGGLPFK